MEALVELPGVGRKTANVVLGHALGVPGLPVDRHVLRVANRIGIATSDDPVIVEHQLGAALPPPEWIRASDMLILHGRRICRPKPLCERCPITADCDYYQHVVSKDRSTGKTAKAAKSRPVARARRPNDSDTEAPKARAPKLVKAGNRDDTEAPKAQGPRRKAEPPQDARRLKSDGGPSDAEAPKARDPRLVKSGNRSDVEAPKARTPRREPEQPRTDAASRTQMPPQRLAPSARGTGRGGGAPRQTDK